MNAADFFKEEDPGINDEYSKDTRNWLYDKNDMVMFAERYYQAKLKLLVIADVSQQRELFNAILDFTEELPLVTEDYNRAELWEKYKTLNCG